jgi:prevent-host-death family protein
MERIGIRELRQRASEVIRRVEAGETFEITDRGRPAAILSAPMPSGLAGLEQQGLIRRGEGRLEDTEPVSPKEGVPLPSELVERGREERLTST